LLDQAIALQQSGQIPEAERLCSQILWAEAGNFGASLLLGIIRLGQGQYLEALELISAAVNSRPTAAFAWLHHGLVLHHLKRYHEALASYEKALGLAPNVADVLNNRGLTLHELGFYQKAIESYDRALALRQFYPEALYNRANALHEVKRFQEAIASYDKAIELRPDYADALNNRGLTMLALKRYPEAFADYKAVLAINPDHAHALAGLADVALKTCDWARAEALMPRLQSDIASGKSTISPLILIGYASDPLLQLQCAKNFVKNRIPADVLPFASRDFRHHSKVRLAYISSDFYQHATAFLIAELLERHDRSKFDVFGISFGPDDRSETRSRLVRAFDVFHDVSTSGDRDVAKLLNGLDIDIAVDLQGYTLRGRTGIFSYRPAPIQVSYLGYPGTLGADFMDYVIADPIVLPFDQQPFWTEKIVHLPDCYQPNDSKRKIAAQKPRRPRFQLPDDAFVFCCFNNNWKITPPIFDVWMRLLKAVEGSVLWLFRSN